MSMTISVIYGNQQLGELRMNLFTVNPENQSKATAHAVSILAEATGHVSIADKQEMEDLVSVCVWETEDSMPSWVRDPEREAWDKLEELKEMVECGTLESSAVKHSWEFKRATLLTIIRQEVCAKYS